MFNIKIEHFEDFDNIHIVTINGDKFWYDCKDKSYETWMTQKTLELELTIEHVDDIDKYHRIILNGFAFLYDARSNRKVDIPPILNKPASVFPEHLKPIVPKRKSSVPVVPILPKDKPSRKIQTIYPEPKMPEPIKPTKYRTISIYDETESKEDTFETSTPNISFELTESESEDMELDSSESENIVNSEEDWDMLETDGFDNSETEPIEDSNEF